MAKAKTTAESAAAKVEIPDFVRLRDLYSWLNAQAEKPSKEAVEAAIAKIVRK